MRFTVRLHAQSTVLMVPMAVSPMLSLMYMCGVGVRMWTEAYAPMPVDTTPVMPMETRQKELLAIGRRLSATLRGLKPRKTTRQMNGTQQAYGHRLRETGQG